MELYETINNLYKEKKEYLDRYLDDIKNYPYIYLW